MTNNGYYRVEYSTDKKDYRVLHTNITDESEPTEEHFTDEVKEWLKDEEEEFVAITKIVLIRRHEEIQPLILTPIVQTNELSFKDFNELVFDNNLEYTLDNGIYKTTFNEVEYTHKKGVNND